MRTTPIRSRKGQDMRLRSWYQKEILRLLVAVLVIGAVLSLNLVFPGAAAELREKCASLILADTDLEQSFSDLGAMLTEGDLPGAVEEWCIAVFAPEEAETPDGTGTSNAAGEAETPDTSVSNAAGEGELGTDGTLSEA